MVNLIEGDILFEDGVFYQVMSVDYNSNTMDLKCYNQPLLYRSVPLRNLEGSSVEILKELPKNITFLR